jgi:peptidoglycan hydrolase-like protein with peptidoglycan-binding domain
MLRKSLTIFMLLALALPGMAAADGLTKIIQQDLTALGYDTGNTEGEMTAETAVAISKFQAENDLDVTGEASPQLAGVIKAKLREGNPAPAAAAAPAARPASDTAALQAAQQACLQEKIVAAQEASQKKRGFGSLMRAATRVAGRFGGDAAADISRTTRDIYDVNATAADLESAAKDLGITESDIEACRNP